MDYSDLEDEDENIIGAEDLFSEDTDNENKDEEDAQRAEKRKEETEEKPKKVQKNIKRSRHKLDEKILNGPHGITLLEKTFKNFEFKGVNHEREDLTKIMEILKNWMCFQLFPKNTFECSMAQLEKIGNKKSVQVLMSKIRMGIHTWGQQEPKNTDDKNNDTNLDNKEEEAEQNNFDVWWQQEMEKIRSDDEMEIDEVQTEAIKSDTEHEKQESGENHLEVTLTAEQLERIARNRKLAEEKRLQRLMSETL